MNRIVVIVAMAATAFAVMGICTIVYVQLECEPPEISWNLRNGATLEAVEWKGQVTDGEEIQVVEGPCKIEIQLPDNKQYSNIAQLIYVERKKSDVVSIKVHGLNGSLDQAALDAVRILVSLDHPTKGVEQWHEGAAQNAGGAVSFTRQYRSNGRGDAIKVLRSFDNRAPWFVSTELHFPSAN